MKKQRLIYVGNFRFPDGDAGGRRVYGTGLALRGSGYDVFYAGAETTGRQEDRNAGDVYAYRGLNYLPAGGAGNKLPQRLWRLWHVHFSGASVISRIKQMLASDTAGIIAYQSSSPVLSRLRRLCTRTGLFLVTDVVEWYDRSHVGGGRFGPFALDSEVRMRYLIPKADGIFAISRYLEDYYSVRSRAVIRVPPLIDTEEECWKQIRPPISRDGSIQIAFVGNAGKKDLVSNAIRGLNMLGRDARHFRLIVVGPSRSEVFSSLGPDSAILSRLGPLITITGRLRQAEALTALSGSDFTFLIRRDARFSRAGFPTKLVESFAMGVPVIANLTGDIGLYVRDGIEGIITSDSTPAAFAEGLKRAIELASEERLQMRMAARKRAVDSFDYKNWISPLGNFISRFS